jgi:hypothetical protein
MLPPELEQQLRGELMPGENLLWACRPLPRLARQQRIFFFVFGFAFSIAGVGWIVGTSFANVHSEGPGWWFTLIGSVFPLVGLPFIYASVWVTPAAQRTVYGITNQRALIVERKSRGGVATYSYAPDRLISMERAERPDGSGDLVFESFIQGSGSSASTVRRGFMAIENVHDVERFIHSGLLAGRVRAM